MSVPSRASQRCPEDLQGLEPALLAKLQRVEHQVERGSRNLAWIELPRVHALEQEGMYLVQLVGDREVGQARSMLGALVEGHDP